MMSRNQNSEPLAHFELSLNSEQVKDFFEAVGWSLPTKPLTPPTVATIFREGEFKALQTFNIPLHKILHGEQKYRFHKDFTAETKYTGTTYLNHHYEKSSAAGSMNFYVFQTKLSDSSGELYVECFSTIIYRS